MSKSVFSPELYIFEANGPELEIPMAYGPRAIARALGAVFNKNGEWDVRHLGAVALLVADYTAGEKVAHKLTQELQKADLQVVFLL